MTGNSFPPYAAATSCTRTFPAGMPAAADRTASPLRVKPDPVESPELLLNGNENQRKDVLGEAEKHGHEGQGPDIEQVLEHVRVVSGEVFHLIIGFQAV